MTKYKIEDLYQMQALPLNAKVSMSKHRILEWMLEWGNMAFVSFSGGKDSTVLLHLVRRMYPDIEAVFIDTGLEYPEVRDYVKTWDNVTILKPDMNFKQVITKYGYPIASKEIAKRIDYCRKGSEWAQKYRGDLRDSKGRPSMFKIPNRWKPLLDAPFMVSSYCCDALKKVPVKRFEKESGKKPFIGILACESKLRTQAWLRNGCNTFKREQPRSMPLSFWTENDILQYVVENDIKLSEIYGDVVETGEYIETTKGKVPKYITTGVNRTGCMFCMFGAHLEKHPNRFERMKETHPKQYEYCMRPKEEGGLGLKEVLDYCNIKY